jgi:CubicO group peptidase (beta-lactamase class C family)
VGDGRGALTATGLSCGSCDTELPLNSKFCDECGAPVTQVSRPAECISVPSPFDTSRSNDSLLSEPKPRLSLARFMFGKPSVRKAIAVATVLLTLAAASSCGYAAHTAVSDGAQATQTQETRAPDAAPIPTLAPDAAPTPDFDFATVSKLMNDAIAAHRLPGAVVVIGHGGNIVFHQAYGSRKLTGEPGLDGSPAPAEPMTEDTIFDLASLTKCLATATAVMQLYEQGKVQFDDPVQKYLPDFNTANDPQRAKVTVRMLLTNTSGEPGYVDHNHPWD